MPSKDKETSKSYTPFQCALNKLMSDNKTTHSELAKYLGKTRQAVSYYCSGQSAPDFETLVKIANYFNTTSDYLLGIEPSPEKKPSAVNELGLDPYVIHRIRQIKTSKTIGARAAQQGMNFFLSASLKDDAVFYKYISQLCDAVEIEKSSALSDLMIPGTEEASGLTEAERNRMAEVMIWKALEDAYPGVMNRMHFTFGHSSIKPRVDEICDLFREMLEDMTGYKRLKEG